MATSSSSILWPYAFRLTGWYCVHSVSRSGAYLRRSQVVIRREPCIWTTEILHRISIQRQVCDKKLLDLKTSRERTRELPQEDNHSEILTLDSWITTFPKFLPRKAGGYMGTERLWVNWQIDSARDDLPTDSYVPLKWDCCSTAFMGEDSCDSRSSVQSALVSLVLESSHSSAGDETQK